MISKFESFWERPSQPHRWTFFLLYFALGSGALLLLFQSAAFGFWPHHKKPRPRSKYHRIIDRAGILRPSTIRPLDRYLEEVFEESDIDIRILFVPSITGETIESFAVKEVEALRVGGIGKKARGLLLVYDVKDRRLRVEVGYGLEGYFTDAFLSYLTHEHTRLFFASGNLGTGLMLLVRMLHHRIREAELGNDFDPRVLKLIRNRGYLSGGGGVTEVMSRKKGNRFCAGQKIPGDEKALFVPQPTPKAVYKLYIAWLAAGDFDPQIGIFTPKTQARLATLPITPAYFHYILMMEYGKAAKFDIRGNVALQYFTNDPLVCPHFYRKTKKGWQMDLVAEIRDTRNRVQGVFSWDYRGMDDIYTRTFLDRLINIKGYVRIIGGDNRELPLRN